MNTALRLINLETSALSDALGKTGAMDHDLQCRSANSRMAGPAFTVRVHTADILMVAKALSMCPADHVLVVDGQGELNTALWGGITTEAGRLKGLAGVVIDGAIRDSGVIRKSALPVFARAVVPNAGGAEYAGETQIAIQCGGAVVCPGDWLVGDDDGVVVIPSARVDEVAEGAERILAAEATIIARVAAGEDLAAILRCDETLARKAASTFIPQLRIGGEGK